MMPISFLVEGVNCNGTIIPDQLVDIIHLIYNGIRIGVPIILIIVGMFDMGKAITQQKEDEIKKAQSLLVRKAVAAVLVFLMFSIVSMLFGVVSNGSSDKTTIWACVDDLLKGNSSALTPCTPDGSTQACTKADSSAGTQTCSGGYWSACQ